MRTLNNLAVANGNPNRATDNNNLLLNNRSSIARLRSVTNNSCNSSNNCQLPGMGYMSQSSAGRANGGGINGGSLEAAGGTMERRMGNKMGLEI